MSVATAPDRFETVAWAYSQSDLAVLLSLFEHEDIHVQAIGRGHASVDWSLTTAFGGIELRVHQEDAGDARVILAGLDPCPARAGLLTGFWPADLAFFAIVILVLGIGSPPRQMPAYLTGGATVGRDVEA